MGSSGAAWFIELRPGSHQVNTGSFGYALGDVGFIRDRKAHWGDQWGSLGSSWVAGFIVVHPELLLCSSGVDGIIKGSLGSLGCALGVVRYIRGSWVHYDAPRGLSGSCGVAVFI